MNAVAVQPQDPDRHQALARFYREQDRAAEAVWECQEAASLRPQALMAPVSLAAALGGLRLHELAVSLLEEALRRQPGAVEVRRELAEGYLATGRPERAAAVLAADESGVRGSPDGLLTLGRTQWALGRLVSARAAFRELQGRWPESAEGEYWLGRVAWVTGRDEEARRRWERAARMAPADPRFPYSLGRSYAAERASGSADRAGAAFDEALHRAPGYGPALLQLGLLYQRHGRYREAARYFLKAVENAPTDFEPHWHLAAVLGALGEAAEAHRQRGLYYSLSDQPARAVAEYERFQAAAPDRVDGPLLISQSYIQMQQNERATAVVQAALRRHPRAPALIERLVTLYILTHSRTEAAQTGEAWLRDQPEDARPYWLLGRVALGNNRREEAVRHFEAALARDPNDAEYCFALGAALARQPSSETGARALALLRRAVDLEPGAPDYRYRLGAALQRHGEWEPARREFLATLNLDPNQAAAYNGLAQVSQGLRRPHQVTLWARAMRAVQDRRRAEKLQRREAGARPRDPSLYYVLAQTLLRGGELAKAQSQLEQALQLRPDWPEARRLFGRVRALRAVLQ